MWRPPLDDRTTGVIGVVAGVALFGLASTQITESSELVPGTDSPVLQSDFFPFVVAAVLTLAGAWLTVSKMLRRRRGGPDVDIWPFSTTPRRILAVSVAFVAAIYVVSLLIEPLGFIVATFLLAAGLSRAFGAPSWWHAGGTALFVSTVIYFAFTQLFSVPLPALLG